MKLAELKKAVYGRWEARHHDNDAIVQPENFKPEIKQYGDLRRKATWIKALCRLEALDIFESCLDAYELITIQFNLSEGHRMHPYRHQLFEEFLAIPGALETLRFGFEQLFSSDFTTAEREQAREFFAMVEEQSRGRGIEWQPAQFAGRAAELAGATAS